MTNIVSLRNVRKTFNVAGGMFSARQELIAVADISFDIRQGSTFGLVGESGSGKTTTAKLVLGAEEPTNGTVEVDGRDIAHQSKAEQLAFRRLLQPVLQDPYSSLSPRMRVGRIVDEPLRIHRVTHRRAERAERVSELLKRVGLAPSLGGHFPNELSGGQRQRIAIARALSVQPRCIVLDEPVSALDVSIQAQILNLLKDLQDDLGIAYLLISHDLAVVSYMSARIGVMYLGRLVEVGSKSAILNEACHPYTLALISAASPTIRQIPVRGEIPSPLAPPPGCSFHTRCPLADQRCREEAPELRSVGEDHQVACHYAESSRSRLDLS